jgi:PAS domain-containing protein
MVTWGGDPSKPMIVGNDPSQLSPRRSFAQWHQLVERTSEPWSPAELTAARLIGESLADVVLQFRSVRALIAQDQLTQVREQVQQSDQPVLIADAGGRILLTNGPFERLLPASHPRLESVLELGAMFTEPMIVQRNLRELVAHRHAWRGEVGLRRDDNEPLPLLVRGDPVLASGDRLLGFVLLFADLTERKAAEAARRRFQEGIVGQRRVLNVRLDSQADLVYRNLLASVLGNAQLAALEITDGVDPARMPEMLDSVRASVGRTATLLECLLWHASRSGKP